MSLTFKPNAARPYVIRYPKDAPVPTVSHVINVISAQCESVAAMMRLHLLEDDCALYQVRLPDDDLVDDFVGDMHKMFRGFRNAEQLEYVRGETKDE